MLSSIEPQAASAGARVHLTGGGFHPDPSRNLVSMDGFRARVLSASESRLEVEVPRCLPERSVRVAVAVDSLSSGELPFDVRGGTTPAPLPVGGDFDAPVDGLECTRLGPGTYLLVVQSAATAAGARFDFSLRGLGSDPSPGAWALDSERPRSLAPDPVFAWTAELRRREAEALRRSSSRFAPKGAVPAAAPRAVPEVGEEQDFRVSTLAGGFRQVSAVARVVGRRVVLYEDVEAPARGLLEHDLEELVETFDEVIYPVIARVFGTPSDVDANDRVLILLTPAVNELTPPGATTLVGGFFFGVDLLPNGSGNAGEVLYGVVPDPSGRFGPPLTREIVTHALPSVLAHEFQHMVHFNQRMLVRDAERGEAVWLSEALAQRAEVLVGDTLRARGLGEEAVPFTAPTLHRAREFLSDAGSFSLLGSTEHGSLGERGAAWLFLRYLEGQAGGVDLLRRLTTSTRTGIENVEAEMGRAWPELFSDWGAANFTDGLPSAPGRLQYLDLDLRSLLAQAGGYPLVPPTLTGDFELRGSRISSSTAYYLLEVRDPEGAALRLSGPRGRPPPTEARFALKVVRIQ